MWRRMSTKHAVWALPPVAQPAWLLESAKAAKCGQGPCSLSLQHMKPCNSHDYFAPTRVQVGAKPENVHARHSCPFQVTMPHDGRQSTRATTPASYCRDSAEGCEGHPRRHIAVPPQHPQESSTSRTHGCCDPAPNYTFVITLKLRMYAHMHVYAMGAGNTHAPQPNVPQLRIL